MHQDYEPRQRAEGKIRITIDRLIDKYPFHVAILERFKIAARPAVGTMGVTVADNDVLLLHNPDFVLNTQADELAGVLLHEVHHVLFNHVLTEPADYPDQWALTIAEEVTVNEFVKEPLPAGVITLDQYPDLPPMESTDKRYARLKRRTIREAISMPGAEGIAGASDQKVGQNSQQGGQCGQQIKNGSKSRTANGSDGASAGHSSGTVDDHSVWKQALKNPSQSMSAIENVIYEAMLEIGIDNVPEQFRGAIENAPPGARPGDGCRELHGDGDGQLDWRRLLRHYVGQLVEIRPVFTRPPRRFPDLVGIVPGRRRQFDRPKIMAVIDTSGSITPGLLKLINVELCGLARHFEVTVVECDCDIHAVYKFRRPLKCVSGRGGTDLRPPLEGKFLRRYRPDVTIYFTDGMGPAPAKQPRARIIWCLTPTGQSPANWGRIIRMDASKDETEG